MRLGEESLMPGHTWCPGLAKGGVTLFTRESGCSSLTPYTLSGLGNLIEITGGKNILL